MRRPARGLAVAAALLAGVLLGTAGTLCALVAAQSPAAPGVPGHRAAPVVTDRLAPVEDEEGPEDEGAEAADARAAELALDPARQTDWRYEGTGEKVVYLTFDDGPSRNTPRVLDVLDRYGVKATFFVTGSNPDLRGYIREAYERGHSVGLHSYTHDYASVYASPEAYFSDLERVGEVVREQIGFVPYLVRFPGGTSNTVSASSCPGIMSELSVEVPARGYQYYDWNVSSGDASGTNVAADSIVRSSCVEGYTNVMLLFHDAATKDTTVDALPRIIEYYQARGYSFAAIDRSAYVCHHGVNN